MWEMFDMEGEVCDRSDIFQGWNGLGSMDSLIGRGVRVEKIGQYIVLCAFKDPFKHLRVTLQLRILFLVS